MSFELPRLAAADAAQLRAELLRRIPMLTTSWTNFNESDPGVTLLEMLVWITELLAYQADTVPLAGYEAMLQWVLGLAHSSDADKHIEYLETGSAQFDVAFNRLRGVLAQVEAGEPFDVDALRRAVRQFRVSPYLGLTLGDVQAIAVETNVMIDPSDRTALHVKRAYAGGAGGVTNVFVLSDLVWQFAPVAAPEDAPPGWCAVAYQGSMMPAGVTLLTPDEESTRKRKLLQNVRTHLQPRTLLGNQISVRSAQLTPVTLYCGVQGEPLADRTALAQSVMDSLLAYLQPDPVGVQPPWVYGQAPTSLNLLARLSAIPGVLSVVLPQPFFGGGIELQHARLGVNTWLGYAEAVASDQQIFKGLPQPRYIEVQVAESTLA